MSVIVPCGTHITMDCVKSYTWSTCNYVFHLCTLFCVNVSSIFRYIVMLIAYFYRMFVNVISTSSESFVSQFESLHGPSHPKFFDGSLSAAQSAAFREGRLFAAYIHSGKDHVSDEILTNKLLIEVLDANCILYAGDIEGYLTRRFIHDIGVMKLPTLSIMFMKSPNDYSLLTKIEDFSSPESVILKIINAIDTPTASVASTEELHASRHILSEQDAEFQRAVEIDMAKMLNRKLEHNDAIRHRKRKELVLRRQALINERMAFAKQHTKTCPTGNTKIRIRLPSGMTLESVFNKDDPVQKLYDWIGAAEYFSKQPVKIPYNFDLSVPYPSKTLDNRSQTLEDANLFPNASLILISRDDSDEDDV